LLLTYGHTDLSRLDKFLQKVVEYDRDFRCRAMERQKQQALKAVASEKILQGVAIGAFALTDATPFLPDTYQPGLQGDGRRNVAGAFLLTDMVLDSLEPGAGKLEWWYLSRAVGDACVGEVLGRLANHPISRDVYELVRPDDGEALKVLFRRVQCKTRDLHYRRTHTAYFQASERKPPRDDEKDSELMLLLLEKIDKKIKADSEFKELPDWARPYVTLRLAMDGKFNILPIAVRNSFIDFLKEQYAEKRGGKVTDFKSILPDGTIESRQNAYKGEETEGPSALWGKDTGQRRPRSGVVEAETNDVWYRVTADLRAAEPSPISRVEAEAGSAARLLRFYLEHPDALDDPTAKEWTDAKIAQELGVTVKTIYNYRQRLRPLLKKHLLSAS
jgi:hypothetical protein